MTAFEFIFKDDHGFFLQIFLEGFSRSCIMILHFLCEGTDFNKTNVSKNIYYLSLFIFFRQMISVWHDKLMMFFSVSNIAISIVVSVNYVVVSSLKLVN